MGNNFFGDCKYLSNEIKIFFVDVFGQKIWKENKNN